MGGLNGAGNCGPVVVERVERVPAVERGRPGRRAGPGPGRADPGALPVGGFRPRSPGPPGPAQVRGGLATRTGTRTGPGPDPDQGYAEAVELVELVAVERVPAVPRGPGRECAGGPVSGP